MFYVIIKIQKIQDSRCFVISLFINMGGRAKSMMKAFRRKQLSSRLLPNIASSFNDIKLWYRHCDFVKKRGVCGGARLQVILATAATSSPGLTFMMRTPCVDRPCTRISLAGILMTTPSFVVTRSSSSSETVVVQQT